ncbi:HTH-type transcriptional repressor KstR2 [Bacteroidales bacterium Barb4]|nr:HTH-type transcriptional repressor KstR2 [Bacteroidales bacterium Barb4]
MGDTIFFAYFCAPFGDVCNLTVDVMASKSVSKTRDMLVDVARQLFARTGVDDTTMNDIAQASCKGRRTLYTYFKSKNEIYLAVVESELNKLYKMLLDVAAMSLPADEKLISFIYTRLNTVKMIVFRNGTLRATFFRDIWRVEKVRKNFDLREIEIIKGILDDGVKEGVFQMPDTNVTALVLHYSLKGLEVPYIRGLMGNTVRERIKRRNNVINLIFNGIKTNVTDK